MSKPKVLDLFCKAGGCSRGYAMAGFEPSGIGKTGETYRQAERN